MQKASGKELFVRTGVLNVGRQDSKFLREVMESAREYGLIVESLQAEEVNKRWPGIRLPADHAGCYEPNSGVLKSEECITAYRCLVQEAGVHIITNSKVLGIDAHKEEVTVRTKDHCYYARSLIISAGAWAYNLLSQLGLKLPLQPVRKTFAWFHADEGLYGSPHFPAYLFETPIGTYYGFPSMQNSGLKIGRHDGGRPINPDNVMSEFGVYEDDEADLMRFFAEYMPGGQVLQYGKTCKYTMTLDEDFIVDLHPIFPHIAVAAGFSGHGFKFASVVGEILCDLIINGSTSYDITKLSIRRFMSGH